MHALPCSVIRLRVLPTLWLSHWTNIPSMYTTLCIMSNVEATVWLELTIRVRRTVPRTLLPATPRARYRWIISNEGDRRRYFMPRNFRDYVETPNFQKQNCLRDGNVTSMSRRKIRHVPRLLCSDSIFVRERQRDCLS